MRGGGFGMRGGGRPGPYEREMGGNFGGNFNSFPSGPPMRGFGAPGRGFGRAGGGPSFNDFSDGGFGTAEPIIRIVFLCIIFFKVPALEVGEVGVEVMALVEVEEAEVLGVVEEVEVLDEAAVALLVVVTLEEVDMTDLMMGTPLRSTSLK